VAQLFEKLCCKPESRGFEPQWGLELSPSGRTVTLESTQSPTEMSNRVFTGEQRRPVRRANNLATFMCGLWKFWEPPLPGALRVYPGVNRNCFTVNYDSNPFSRKTKVELYQCNIQSLRIITSFIPLKF
jgi:hypothetical protein